MTTEVETYTETGLRILDEKEESLKALAEQFQGLTVAGLEDKEGFDKLRKARITLKNERVAIKSAAEDLRAPAVKWQKKVIEREKQLIAIIEPVEADLHTEEKRIDALKEEARKQKEIWEAKVLQDRLNGLAQYNFAADWVEVKHMTDEQFDEMLAHAKNLHEEELKRQAELKAEEERKAKEEAERLQAEREALAKQKAEQEARERELRQLEQEAIDRAREQDRRIKKEQEVIMADLRAQQAKVADERRAIEEEKRKHEEAVRIEAAKKEAAERAIQEEQARIKREAEEKVERERLAKLEAERQEALKPDKEKLLAFADQIGSLILPTMHDQECGEVLGYAMAKLEHVQSYIKDQVAKI